MQADQGGDGVAMGGTGEQPVGTMPPITGDRSETAEELNLKIEQELGLPHVEPKATEPETPVEPAEPVDEPAEEAEETAVEPETEEEEPVAAPEPATPSDDELFIEVEDAEGVTHKISKIEDLPEDFSPKNNRQILEIVTQLTKLDAQLSEREATRARDALAAEQAQTQQEQFDAWDNEIAELVKSKRITSGDTETTNKVLEFMAKVNTDRTKAGNPNLIYSFEDALDKYEIAQAKDAETIKKTQDNERAKVKASLIGGSNSTGAGSSPVYVSGSARSMDDIII